MYAMDYETIATRIKNSGIRIISGTQQYNDCVSIIYRQHSIDNFSESLDILSAFMNNIAEYKVNNKIRFLIMDTIEAAKEFEDKSIEIVFLNTNHSYESVKQDLLQWCPKIRMGGYLICHDFTSPDHPEVREAINALQLNGTLLCGSLWCGQKS